MNTNQKYPKKLLELLSGLLLVSALIILIAAAEVQPAQAALLLRRTPLPTRTPTPISTLPPTSIPYATPTPGPTTTVPGTWKIVSSPNVGTGTYGNKLNAVAALSANDVWAVGFSPNPSGTPLYIRQSLIEQWNGSNWNVVSSPNPAGKPDVELNGIAALSANDIWAVGHSGDPSYAPLQTLTEHWDGTSWSIVSSPSPGTYNGNDLTAVAAISSNDVWAVGWYQSGPTGQEGGALTMHWDGSHWTVVPNPSKATLYAIVAIASNDVWAVGAQVILHWNGTGWSSVSFPLPYYQNGIALLQGISATSASDIWAVGYDQYPYFEGYFYAPLTYHWDGISWSLVPNAGGTNEVLHAVAALAANDVWAVGDNGQFQHWNGLAWSRVTAPYPGGGGSLNGLAATSSSDIWAVGWYSDNTTYQLRTWIERYTIP